MKKYFLFSLLGHALIVVSAILIFMTSNSLEKQPLMSIKSYLVSKPVIIKKNGLVKLKKMVTQKIKKNQNISSLSENTTHDELLRLLHQAIAERQQYPESAIALNQTGTVKIGMMINPNGIISQASVMKSSGVEAIDSAALEAVKAISPFQPAVKLLQAEQFFSVDVMFSLI